MKITEADSEQIYRLAKDSKNPISNVAIAKQFGITEAAVRFHIKRQSEKLVLASLSQGVLSKPINALSLDCRQQAANILSELQQSIVLAKTSGVSPEKLSGLYNAWIKSLELASELLGQRTPPTPTSQGGGVIQIIIGNPSIPPKRVLNVTPPEEQARQLSPSPENYKNETITTAEQDRDEPVEHSDNYKNEVINTETQVTEPEAKVTPAVTEPEKRCTCFDNGAKRYREYIGTHCTTCGGFVQ